MGKLKWSDITTQALLKTLHEQALQGKKAENSFKKKGMDQSTGGIEGLPRY